MDATMRFRRFSRRAVEHARAQAGVELADHGIDVVYRQSRRRLQRGYVRRHIGTFQDDRTDVGMARDEFAARSEDVLLRERHVEIVFRGLDDHAKKLAAVLDPDDGRIEGHAGRFEMRGR